MIRISTLGRVVAVALAVGASAPLAAQEDWQRGRGFQQEEEEVRRVGRRGREDDEENSAADEASRYAEREAERARREEERAQEHQQREAERAQREQERANEQYQREAERAQQEQQRAYEQQQQAEQAQRAQQQAEQDQRAQQQAWEQQQRDIQQANEQHQREAERAQAEQQRQAEIEQRQAQRQLEREQRQVQMEQARQRRESEQQMEQQRRQVERGGRDERIAEQERVRAEQEAAAAAAQRGEPRDERYGRGGRGERQPAATGELQRLEQERYQVERGGDRDRYQDFREGREGREGRDRNVTEQAQPDWRDRNQRFDASGDVRRQWNVNPREVPQPLPGARLSERERRSLYDQQRHSADRYRQDWQRRIQQEERRTYGLRDRRGEQFRYQQRYWQRHRDWNNRWTSFRWDFNRDPYFYTAPTHRYYRGGRWYRVNQYALDVLQQAIQVGYEEGFYAGQADRADGWRFDYRNNFVYEDANLGYQGWYVSQFEYNHYFREGFRRGYEDGYYRRWRYGRRYDRGYAILPNELDVILRFERFR